MTTAREIMTQGADTVESSTTVLEVAKRLAAGDYGSMPICDDGALKGMITDRDIVVKVLAQGKDPATTTAIELVDREVVTIGADDPVEDAARAMAEHQVRRLPVLDGTTLVGMLAQADLALAGSDRETGETVAQISK